MVNENLPALLQYSFLDIWPAYPPVNQYTSSSKCSTLILSKNARYTRD